MKILKSFCKILGSHFFIMLLIAVLYGLTAISPDIMKNPVIFMNYMCFICLNVYISETEKEADERRTNDKIDNLQKQIDELKNKTNK